MLVHPVEDIMKSLFLLLAGCLLVAAGCAKTVPVHGYLSSDLAVFSGKATGSSDERGELELTGPDGLSCKGPFTYVTPRHAEGTLTCSDGRTGQFSFVSNGDTGTGTGMIGNEQMRLTLGNE